MYLKKNGDLPCIKVDTLILHHIVFQVTRVVLLWVNNHFNDFESDPAMNEFLEKFEILLEREVSTIYQYV